MNQIDLIRENFQKQLLLCKNISNLQILTTTFLGRQGEINHLFKTLPIKNDKGLAIKINLLKNEIESKIKNQETKLLSKSEKIDLTIPSGGKPVGSIHLISKAIEEIQQIFERLGFVRRRYPEVDTDWYYAEGLNIPKDHPARDDQETFYLSSDIVLTAHTSNGQLHEMENHPLPIRMINIGKTYRRQADTSHNPMFHQFEGLVVDKDINISHLIGVTNYFAKQYFGENRQIRLRPHHFQFTEPSFEIDITCDLCQGSGVYQDQKCKMCKSGWLELGGAGMVHPNVIKNGGLDPKKVSGFAFGWGVERVLMMKSGLNIPDLRLLFSDDLRFISQFK